MPYKNVKEDIDLKYELLESRLKESIILNSKKNEYNLIFESNIGDLLPSYNEKDNSLELN